MVSQTLLLKEQERGWSEKRRTKGETEEHQKVHPHMTPPSPPQPKKRMKYKNDQCCKSNGVVQLHGSGGSGWIDEDGGGLSHLPGIL